MDCIIICDNARDSLNGQPLLKYYLSEIRHIHHYEKLSPYYFPWIELVLEKQEFQRGVHLMVALFLSNLIL